MSPDSASDGSQVQPDGGAADRGARDQLAERLTDDALAPDTNGGDINLGDLAATDVALSDVALADVALADAALPDVAVADAALPDAALPDVAVADAVLPDAALPDAGTPDTLPQDLGVDSAPDLMLPDRGLPDSSPLAPLIQNVAVTNIGRHSATITFTTTAPATATVYYDLDRLTKQVSDATLRTSHSLVVDRMLSAEQQSFRIFVTDAAQQQRVGQRRTFTTLSYATTTLPAGWSAQDIGPVSTTKPGISYYDGNLSGGTFSLRSAGDDIFFSEDSFHFAAIPVSGDFTLTARIDAWYGYLDLLSKGVTMFRSTLASGSPMVTQSVNYDEDDYLYYRASANTDHVVVLNTELNSATGAPLWIRLRRVGNTFTQYYSQNGTTWTIHGPAAGTTLGLPQSGYAGLGVASKNIGFLTEVVFSNVSLTTP